jgi:hypothetical protein
MRQEPLEEFLFGVNSGDIAPDEVVKERGDFSWAFAGSVRRHGVKLAEFRLQSWPSGLAGAQTSLQCSAVLEETAELVLRQFRLAASHSFDKRFHFVTAYVVAMQMVFGSKVAPLQVVRPNIVDGLGCSP